MSRVEKIARKFIGGVAQDFNVDPPEVSVSEEEAKKECPHACGCYDYRRKKIILSPRCFTLETLLHEFAHHLQLAKAKGDPYEAYKELSRTHCERPHEVEAKGFSRGYSSYYSKFYHRMWEEVGREG